MRLNSTLLTPEGLGEQLGARLAYRGIVWIAGVCLAVLAGDLLLAQLSQQMLESLSNPIRTTLELARLDSAIQSV
jgi:hypothetical protein